MTSPARPLVTFALFAYRQERFIREAVRGALAQTYSPLQVILSDDCSPDRTWAIMQEEAARYRGSHQVVLNRTPRNVGLASHFENVMHLAEGELIVVAAGDDVSLPHRAELTSRHWQENGRRVMSFFSSYELIDESAATIKAVLMNEGPHHATAPMRIRGGVTVEGASHGFDKRVYRDFGSIAHDAVNEDVILQFRAALRDGVFVIGDPLVKYRQHGANISDASLPFAAAKRHERILWTERSRLDRYLRCLKNFRKDLDIARSREWVAAGRAAELAALVEQRMAQSAARLDLLGDDSTGTTARIRRLIATGVSPAMLARDLILLGSPVTFDRIRHLKGAMRNAARLVAAQGHRP